MDAPAIFTRLQTLGAVLSATPDGKVRVHVRKGLLTDDDRRAIGDHKAELLATLRAAPAADYVPPTWSRRYELKKAGVPNWWTPAPLPWLDNPERN